MIDPKAANVAYHDWEAATYESKWAIGFDDRCTSYVVGRFAKALHGRPRAYGRVLEVGCGTGFFLLNLARAGYVGEAHVTDISAQMVARCTANGHDLGVEVIGTPADLEALPYPDASFDLVVGHAVLHHVPDLPRAMAEIRRVLRPGGRVVIAGEPTRLGDAIAARVKRVAREGVSAAARILGPRLLRPPTPRAPEEQAVADLEWQVDLHVFAPAELRALALAGGLTDVEVLTEELTANWFGWVTRTVEAMLADGVLPDGYPALAYRTWRSLFWIDEHLLRPVLPEAIFYNAILTGVRPAA